MPEIQPFRGILYNRERVRLDDVIAPPYDVITPRGQSELYEASPFNCVRLVLGREENRYASAAATFKQWMSDGILSRDPTPAVYILSQLFRSPAGKNLERRGFIAACRLEDFGKGSVFPHEMTLSNPKEDRFRLFLATGAMFSQIFALYSDPGHRLDAPIHTAMKTTPTLTAELDGVLNVVWRLADPQSIRSLAAFLAGQKVFVADGHHRYETALLYRDAMRLKSPGGDGSEPFNFVPMFFSNMNDGGLIILPTHRVLHSLSETAVSGLLDALPTQFTIDPLASAEELMLALPSHPRGSFGLVVPPGPRYLLIRRRGSEGLADSAVPPTLHGLDVLVLHRMIFRDILKMTEEDQAGKKFLDYEKDAGRAVEAVASGQAQAAFLMNPTSIDQVRDVAEAGYTMPQKSTYFHPKLVSGLVNYAFVNPGES